MIFNFIRKIANKFGIQILKVSTYDRLVKNLSLEARANSELSDAIVKSLHKEHYQSQKIRILLGKINGLKNSKNKLSAVETAYLLDTSSLATDALNSLEERSSIPVFFKERAQPTNIKTFKSLFNANAKALAAIDFLQSKYAADTSLEKNTIFKKSNQSEAHKLFIFSLNAKKTKAFEAINSLDNKYSTSLQGSKYYE